MDDLDLTTLDPGIRRTVAWLRERGFNTTDSGDGVTKLTYKPDSFYSPEGLDAMPFPNVAMTADALTLITDTDRLYRSLVAWGAKMEPAGNLMDDPSLQATYDRVSGVHTIMLLNVDDARLFGQVTVPIPELPAGRYRKDCTSGSAEEFRDDVLIPTIESFGTDGEVVVDLNKCEGMPPSFTEEVFGGLVRKLGPGIEIGLIGPSRRVNEAREFMDDVRKDTP